MKLGDAIIETVPAIAPTRCIDGGSDGFISVDRYAAAKWDRHTNDIAAPRATSSESTRRDTNSP
jgi:hypothetical protein